MPTRSALLAAAALAAAPFLIPKVARAALAAVVTDTSRLMEMALSIASSSPKIRAYAIEQARVSISQELALVSLNDRVSRLEAPPAPEPEPAPVGLLARFPLPAPTGGTIGARGTITAFNTAGELVENKRLLGHISVRAPGIIFRRCLFEGPTGPVGNQQTGSNGEEIQVRATSASGTATFEECEFRLNGWRAALLSEAPNLQMLWCHIHDNGGTQTGEANLQHGVYWAAGSGLIDHCLIETNRTYGVQMYPGPVGAVMRHTMVRRNRKGGVTISQNARNCLVEDCALGENETVGLEGWNLPAGSGNTARNNYIWGNKQGSTIDAGIAVSGTISTPPPAGW